MSEFNDRRSHEGLPPPSAELAVISAIMESYLETIPPKRAIRHLRLLAETLASGAAEDTANVLPFRRREEQATAALARRRALAWFRMVLPLWMQRLDGGE